MQKPTLQDALWMGLATIGIVTLLLLEWLPGLLIFLAGALGLVASGFES